MRYFVIVSVVALGSLAGLLSYRLSQPSVVTGIYDIDCPVGDEVCTAVLDVRNARDPDIILAKSIATVPMCALGDPPASIGLRTCADIERENKARAEAEAGGQSTE